MAEFNFGELLDVWSGLYLFFFMVEGFVFVFSLT